jgi:drug/metabolite transporter (DMT)-like permease
MRISLLALIWGSGFLLIKIALRGFSPVRLTFSRLALGALVLLIFVAVTRLRLPGRAKPGST